ncbi:hypothetical protein SIRV1gp23 [Sulfolobus islandicus rod-shaped virus 1]|uniref:Uncharacterized protein 84 n=1 Tax=Sulfolobus islandicus rod-shaped virus 1 TaxID=157898 RepID=Y84_SIRV1|nr:hypothetical protein SIRV1gp23 [Sulfolobus islandicus rod-shaped virus 1]Q8QL32.1 RecName: Full=Uncharacterized protein 84 [Sulfolobus islandicus rod-shaped virus 1]CAC93978.1 hypothetical protein [Sulfolobus islandicus rod-shaped virus 1]CAG38842.1 hypothetical protein [Sulfolobus islandicus rudivirus 1 variant XX]
MNYLRRKMKMSETTLVLTIISTTTTTLFAIIQLYLKIKQALKDAVKEIVNSELSNLKTEIEELKIKQDELSRQVEEIKRKLDQK